MRTPKNQTKHNHKDAFNKKVDCPRCAELDDAVVVALLIDEAQKHPKYDPSLPVEVISIPGEQPWVQQRKTMCFLCLQPHRTEDCPHRERALKGGGAEAYVLRGSGKQ